MELLIPGLILVGLMIYASTRIKKSAAKAYEAERIETDEFSIYKPEGLMNPLEARPPFAFEAYSKDFGEKPFGNINQIKADVRIFEDTGIESAVDEIRNAVSSVTSEQSDGNGSLLEAVEVLDGAEMSAIYKLVPKNGKLFRLHIAALGDPNEENRQRIEELLQSFTVK